MSRHKKFVKSEKAKTKLKGNKLAKGLNVTKTDFKIKKIIIREQIKDTTLIEDGAEIRSQNIKVSLKWRQCSTTQNFIFSKIPFYNLIGIVDETESPQCNQPKRRSSLSQRVGNKSSARGEQSFGRKNQRHLPAGTWHRERCATRML